MTQKENSQTEVLDLRNKPENIEIEDFIEEDLQYNLSNCEWMIVQNKPELQFLN